MSISSWIVPLLSRCRRNSCACAHLSLNQDGREPPPYRLSGTVCDLCVLAMTYVC